jgi:hypothetical protein
MAAPDPIAQAARAAAEGFTIGALGPASSHPRFAASRTRRALWTTVVLPVLFLSAFAFGFWLFLGRPGSLAHLSAGLRDGVAGLYYTFVFALAFGFSALLSIRASVAAHPSAASAVASPLRTALAWGWMLLALTALSLLLAWGIHQATGLTRWALAIAAVLPLVALDAGLAARLRPPEQGEPETFSFLVSVFVSSACLAAAVLAAAELAGFLPTRLSALADRLSGWGGIGPALGRLLRALAAQPLARLGGVFALAFLACLMVARLFQLARAAAGPKSEVAPRRGWLSRLWDWFRARPSARNIAAGTSPSDWLRDLERQFQAELDDESSRDRARLLPSATTHPSETAAAPRLDPAAPDWLFGGHTPSSGQVELFTRFRERFEALATRLQEADQRGALLPPRESADLLVASAPGAGRTTAFLALAVYAAVARGQRVLLLCPDAQAAALAADTLNRHLAAAFLDHLVRAAAGCTSDDPWAHQLQAAVDRKSTSAENPLGAPQILAATLPELESLLFGLGQRTDAMRAYLGGVGVILVDALDPFADDPLANLHLPFWLDKLRLAADTRGQPLQVVVGVPEAEGDHAAARAARRLVMNRLLGATDEDEAAFVALPPFRALRAQVVDAWAEGVPDQEVIGALVRALAKLRRKVVVYKSELAPGEAEAMSAEFLRTLPPPSHPLVVGQMHDLEQPELRDAAVIILRDPSGGRLLHRLAARLPDAEPLFIRVGIGQSGEAWDAGLRTTLPLLAGRGSEPLLAQHLRSVAPLLTARAPIRLDRLAKFGLRTEALAAAATPEAAADRQPVASWTLALDSSPPADTPAEDRPALWDLAYLRPSPTGGLPMRPSSLLEPPDESLGFHHDPDLGVILHRAPGQLDPRRYALWCDRDNAPLGPRQDLAALDTLTYLVHPSHPGQPSVRWTPREIRLDPDGTPRILATPWRDDREDVWVPVWTFSFTLPDRLRFRPSPLNLPEGVHLHVAEPHSAPVAVRTTIQEVTTATGRQRPIKPLTWLQDMAATLVVLRTPESRATQAEAPGVAGDWQVPGDDTSGGRQFLPTVTQTWGNSLARLVPGLPRFARLAAFTDLTLPGHTLLFLLEPRATATTVPEILTTLLEEPALAGELPIVGSSASWLSPES